MFVWKLPEVDPKRDKMNVTVANNVSLDLS